ncbi:hypothetical protein ND748_23395, partial [Frankia sp. AiPs1]|uniref:DUF6059 family protein n=1 Tax=Frankia sp. AiPs1 TaxID=573493 RepID=UPI0020438CE2
AVPAAPPVRATAPGHPERVRADVPASRVERLLWRQLADLAVPVGDPGRGCAADVDRPGPPADVDRPGPDGRGPVDRR